MNTSPATDDTRGITAAGPAPAPDATRATGPITPERTFGTTPDATRATGPAPAPDATRATGPVAPERSFGTTPDATRATGPAPTPGDTTADSPRATGPAPTPGPPLNRRRLVAGLTAALAALATGALPTPAVAAPRPPGADLPDLGDLLDLPVPDVSLGPVDPVATLEAFADTIVPGEKRHARDHAVAGAAEGPGAVQAGAVELLRLPDLGLAPLMPALAALLDTEATAYALSRGIVLVPTRPPFVALDFTHRTRLAARLLGPDAVDQQVWVLLALFSSVAFDTAAHLHTTEALQQRHPGLAWLRFPAPDADGLWRFPDYSYGRRLAREHPDTTAGGHPA